MTDWHIIKSGHLTRNKFWGEDESIAYHPCIATTTVIQTGDCNILVDPGEMADDLKFDLYTKCGLKPEDIDIVYSTHKHFDHWMGVNAFEKADFYMAAKDLAFLKEHVDLLVADHADIIRRGKPASGKLMDGIDIIELPGHTSGLAGLLFEASEGKILVSGDAVMTYEFFRAKEGYFFSSNAEESKKSIEKAACVADYIIPGHGNYFSIKAYPFIDTSLETKLDKTGINLNNSGVISLDTLLEEILKLDGAQPLVEAVFGTQMPANNMVIYADVPIGVFIKSLSLNSEKVSAMIRDLNELKEN